MVKRKKSPQLLAADRAAALVKAVAEGPRLTPLDAAGERWPASNRIEDLPGQALQAHWRGDWRAFVVYAGVWSSLLAYCDKLDQAEQIERCLAVIDPQWRTHRAAQLRVMLGPGGLAAHWAEYRRLRFAQRPIGRDRGLGRWPAWVPGESLAGRVLLVIVDGGLGDMIWHARYLRPLAALAAECGGRVVLEPRTPLARLWRDNFQDVVEVCGPPVSSEDPPAGDADTWCLPSAPAELFGTDPSAFSAPYLTVRPALIEQWEAMIAPLAPERLLRVGLVWAGESAHRRDSRLLHLVDLAPLAAVPGVRLFSLQKSSRTPPQLITSIGPQGRESVISIGSPPVLPQDELTPAGVELVRLGPQFEDMADTAAALMSLDLVITVDTSVAHLAGALGRPTWLLLSDWPAWFWEHEYDCSPWYPTMRLFRQERPGGWGPVVERVRRELAGLVGAGSSSPAATPG